MPTSQQESSPIRWLPILGLAGLQAAITLCWVIYNLYIPGLLAEVGFSGETARQILIIENILATVMEPIMGAVSDQLRRWLGTQFPLILIGALGSCFLFVGIPLSASGQGSWILPTLLVAWAFAMTLFRSPAIALLGKYATPKDWPFANSFLTLFSGIMGGLAPLTQAQILSLGHGSPFWIGSGVLLIAVIVLNSLDKLIPQDPTDSAPLDPIRWIPLGLIFGLGVSIALSSRLMLGILPAQVATFFSEPWITPATIVSLIFVVSGIVALPCGSLSTQWGNQRVLLIGLVAFMVIWLGVPFLSGASLGIVLAVLLGITLSLMTNSTIPFVLAQVSSRQGGFAVGLYFGGGSLAVVLFNTFFSQINLTGITALLSGIILIALAGYFVLQANSAQNLRFTST